MSCETRQTQVQPIQPIQPIPEDVGEGKGDFGYNVRAGMFLTTECVIADKKEDTPAMPAAGMNPGMGGMM